MMVRLGTVSIDLCLFYFLLDALVWLGSGTVFGIVFVVVLDDCLGFGDMQ